MKIEILDVEIMDHDRSQVTYNMMEDIKFLMTDGVTDGQKITVAFKQDSVGYRRVHFGKDNIEWNPIIEKEKCEKAQGSISKCFCPHATTNFVFIWNATVKKWQETARATCTENKKEELMTTLPDKTGINAKTNIYSPMTTAVGNVKINFITQEAFDKEMGG